MTLYYLQHLCKLYSLKIISKCKILKASALLMSDHGLSVVFSFFFFLPCMMRADVLVEASVFSWLLLEILYLVRGVFKVQEFLSNNCFNDFLADLKTQ